MRKFYLALIALSLFAFSGCGGGSSSSTGSSTSITHEVKQVIVLSSPALERNKRYRIYKGATLSGMNGSKYYVSNTGSESLQSTINLGFSEEIKAGESFIIVNYAPDYESHSGGVVFAYDPSALNEDFTYGGNVSFTGGNLMRYNALDIVDSSDISEITDSARPYDAEIYAEYESSRGITTFILGKGASLSFIAVDEESSTARNIPSKGNVLQLVRKVNTFSEIVNQN